MLRELAFLLSDPAAHPGWRWRSVVTQASGLCVCAESREDDLEEIQGLSSGLSLAPVPEDCCSPSLFLVAALDSLRFLLQFSLLFQRILIYLNAVLRSLRKIQWHVVTLSCVGE